MGNPQKANPEHCQSHVEARFSHVTGGCELLQFSKEKQPNVTPSHPVSSEIQTQIFFLNQVEVKPPKLSDKTQEN